MTTFFCKLHYGLRLQRLWRNVWLCWEIHMCWRPGSIICISDAVCHWCWVAWSLKHKQDEPRAHKWNIRWVAGWVAMTLEVEKCGPVGHSLHSLMLTGLLSSPVSWCWYQSFLRNSIDPLAPTNQDKDKTTQLSYAVARTTCLILTMAQTILALMSMYSSN
jgi:hypothetical protein